MFNEILAVLKAGHDIGNVGTVNVFQSDEGWMVEVYDPLDDDTNQPYYSPAFTDFLNLNLARKGDICYKSFSTPEEAVTCYLAVHAELSKALK